MRKVALLFCLLVVGFVARPVYAADQYIDCYNASTDDSKLDSGIAVCSRLIESGKWHGLDLTRLLGNRANLYIKKKQLDAAMEDLDRALAITPEYVFAYDDRGDVHRLRGELDQALDDYSHAIRIDSQFLSAWYERGRIYEMMGDKAKARADYRQAIDRPGKDRPIDRWAKDQARDALDRMER